MLKIFLELDVNSEGDQCLHVNATLAYRLFNNGETFHNQECRRFNRPFLISMHKNIIDKHLGQYPVVYIPFKYINGLNDAQAIESLHMLLKRIYMPHTYLIKILHNIYKNINETDKFKKEKAYDYYLHFKNIAEENEIDDDALTNSIYLLCKMLYRKHRKRVVVLIDDYDLPFYKLLHEKHFPESDLKYVLKYIENILSPIIDENNKYIERVVIFGTRCFNDILDVPVFNYTLANNPWIEYFTLTAQEQEELGKKTNKAKHQQLDALSWYTGYRGGRDHTLNLAHQFSVINFMNTGSIRIYFSRIMSFDYTYRLVNIRCIREAFEMLAHKKLLPIDFHDLRFNKTEMRRIKGIATAGLHQQIDQATINLVLSFLCSSGYLTFHKSTSTATLARVWAPNKETLGEICKKLKSFYIRNYGISRFLIDKATDNLRNFLTEQSIRPFRDTMNQLFADIEMLKSPHSNFQNDDFYAEVTEAVLSFISIMWRSLTKYYTVAWKEGKPPVSFMITGKDHYEAIIIAMQYKQDAEHLLHLAKQKKTHLYKYKNIQILKYIGISLDANKTVDAITDTEILTNPP